MTEVGIGLNYWLPRTRINVDVTERQSVTQDVTGLSSVVTVRDVVAQVGVIADTRSPQELCVDHSLLEKLKVTISLDDQGLIESINGEAGRDLTPLVNLVAKVLPLPFQPASTGVADAQIDPAEGSLDLEWQKRFPQLDVRRGELARRVDQLLGEMSAEQTPAKSVVQLGKALAAVQDQLASIGEQRRSWIAAHAQTLGTSRTVLFVSNLHRVTELGPELAAPTEAPDGQEGLWAAGVLVAAVDEKRGSPSSAKSFPLKDHVLLRRCRPVQLGIYRKADDGVWRLEQPSLVSFDVVDEFSKADMLSLDAALSGKRTFEISYHADKSIKTFGVTAESGADTLLPGLAGLAEAGASIAKSISAKPSEDAAALERVKVQLDLLKQTSEFEALSATRGRAVELSVLEQQKAFRDATK